MSGRAIFDQIIEQESEKVLHKSPIHYCQGGHVDDTFEDKLSVSEHSIVHTIEYAK